MFILILYIIQIDLGAGTAMGFILMPGENTRGSIKAILTKIHHDGRLTFLWIQHNKRYKDCKKDHPKL